MTTLLSRVSPFNFAVLACRLDVVLDGLIAQLTDWNARPFRVEHGALDARRLLLSAQGPHNMPSIESGYLLAEVDGPRGPHTLFLSSIGDGGHSVQHCLTRRCQIDLVGFQASDPDVMYSSNSVYLVRNSETLRIGRAMLDSDRWEFFEKGAALWFENPEHYRARVIRKRLTADIIAGYISTFGYGSLELDYWTDASVKATYVFDEGFHPWHG